MSIYIYIYLQQTKRSSRSSGYGSQSPKKILKEIKVNLTSQDHLYLYPTGSSSGKSDGIVEYHKILPFALNMTNSIKYQETELFAFSEVLVTLLAPLGRFIYTITITKCRYFEWFSYGII